MAGQTGHGYFEFTQKYFEGKPIRIFNNGDFHRCRHTVGTQLLQRGVPIDRVQDVLGHADISTTRRYAKTAPEAVLKLAAKLDSLEEERALYTYALPEKSVQVSLLRYMSLI